MQNWPFLFFDVLTKIDDVPHGDVKPSEATQLRGRTTRGARTVRWWLPRWFGSVTSLVAVGTACLLSMVSEAAVETQSNRSEGASGDGSLPAEAQMPGEQVQRQHWHSREITVVLDSSLGALPDQAEALVQKAFATWQNTGAYLPKINFISGRGAAASLKPDGQNTVLVAPIQFKGHETDLAITIGFSNPGTGEISEADIVINERHLFKSVDPSEVLAAGHRPGVSQSPQEHESCTGSLDAEACQERYDLQNVLAHEVGHFFGLGENYIDTRATMFSCTSACETHKRDLGPSDFEEIHLLYEAVLLKDSQDFMEDMREEGCTGVQIGGHPKHLRIQRWTGWILLLMAVTLRRRQNRIQLDQG